MRALDLARYHCSTSRVRRSPGRGILRRVEYLVRPPFGAICRPEAIERIAGQDTDKGCLHKHHEPDQDEGNVKGIWGSGAGAAEAA